MKQPALRGKSIGSIAILAGIAMLVDASSASASFKLNITRTPGAALSQSDPTETMMFQSISGSGWGGGFTAISDPSFILSNPTNSASIDLNGSISYNGGTLPASITITLTRAGFALSQWDASMANLLQIASMSSGVSVTVQSWVNYGSAGNNEFVLTPMGPGAVVGQVLGANNFVTTAGSMTRSGPISNPPGLYQAQTLNGAVPASALGSPFSLTQQLTFSFANTGGVVEL